MQQHMHPIQWGAEYILLAWANRIGPCCTFLLNSESKSTSNFTTLHDVSVSSVLLERHCEYIIRKTTKNVYYSDRAIHHFVRKGPWKTYSILLKSRKSVKREGFAKQTHHSYTKRKIPGKKGPGIIPIKSKDNSWTKETQNKNHALFL